MIREPRNHHGTGIALMFFIAAAFWLVVFLGIYAWRSM